MKKFIPPTKNKITALAFAILPVLITGLLAYGANIYYDLDAGKIVNGENNELTQNLTVAGSVGIGTTSPAGALHVVGQCVTGDTKLRRRRRKSKSQDPNSKDEYEYEDVEIKDIQAGDEILTLDENTGRLTVSRVNALMDMGVKEIYKLTTATGKTIRTTANHPYLAREPKTARTYAFIDASNIIYGCRQSGWRMDFKKLYSYLKNRFGASRIIYYAGEDVANARQQAFYNLLRQWGYELVIKPVKTFTGESGKITKKANVDVDLTFEAMLYFGEYDRAVFFTGDGDFYRLIAHCEVNKQRVWLFGNAERTARELKTLMGHRFSNLDNLRSGFEYFGKDKENGASNKKGQDPTIGSARCIMGSSYQAQNCVSRGDDGQATKNPAFDGATSTLSMYLNETPLVKGEMKKEKAPAKAEVASLPLLCGKQSSLSSDDGGRWTKVADICEGMEIATADENSGRAVWERIAKIEKLPAEQVYDIEVEGTHNFVGNGIVAHNTYLQGADQLNTSFALRVQDSAAADNFVVTNAGNVGIGTTDLSGAKFKIAGDGSTVADNYNDLSQIAGNTNAAAVSGKLQIAEAACGSYTIQGAGGLTYGTVLGPDGKCWLDRNLGATQVATSASDVNSYGYYYQWGRPTDGHQIENSGTTAVNADSDIPGHANFITEDTSPYDWRVPQSPNEATLWAGAGGGSNNPCPAGWHVPTSAEWVTVAGYFSPQTSVGAFNSTLKLPLAGNRTRASASLYNRGSLGHYWSGSPSGTNAAYLYFYSSAVNPANSNNRATGFSVRCVKD